MGNGTVVTCGNFACPDGYKYRHGYETRDCVYGPSGTCASLENRDVCCRKEGWPWWAWLMLALALCCCYTACCCPAALAPLAMGGKKKKKSPSAPLTPSPGRPTS